VKLKEHKYERYTNTGDIRHIGAKIEDQITVGAKLVMATWQPY